MNAKPRLFSRFGYIVFLIAFSLFATSTAFAESGSVKKVIQLSKAAMEDYDNFELEDADTKLIQAVQMVENLGVTDPGVANVYIAQGIVSFGRFKDSVISIAEDRAYTAFLKALTLNPNVEIPEDYRSDELQVIFEKAKKDLTPSTSSARVAVVATKPTIEHSPVMYNNRCAPLKIVANVPAHPEIYRTFVYYASDEELNYTSLEMRPTPESADILEAYSPRLATRGDRVKYYIEAQDRLGHVVAYSAGSYSPMVVTIEGECEGLSAEEKAQTYGDPLFQLSLLFGTAVGYGNGDTTYYEKDNLSHPVSIQPGAVILPFHMRVSAMFNLPEYFQLGVFLRAQFVNIASKIITDSSPARGDYDKPWMYNLLLGIDFRYLALHKQPYRLYVGFEFGWGGANATVTTYPGAAPMYVYDGPWHIAPEIGFLWSFHKNVGLAVEVAVPIYFPNRPSVHCDISVGPYFQF